MAQTVNMEKHIWEGWTVRNFIEELEPLVDMIMKGNAMTEPFKNKKEMSAWIKDNQPYYKKAIADVNNYFAKKYHLK